MEVMLRGATGAVPFPLMRKSLTSSAKMRTSPRPNISTCRLTTSAAPHKIGRKLPVLLFDIMDTVVRDPFYHDVPAFFGMSFKELIESKHPTAWIEFEKGIIDEFTIQLKNLKTGNQFYIEAFSKNWKHLSKFSFCSLPPPVPKVKKPCPAKKPSKPYKPEPPVSEPPPIPKVKPPPVPIYKPLPPIPKILPPPVPIYKPPPPIPKVLPPPVPIYKPLPPIPKVLPPPVPIYKPLPPIPKIPPFTKKPCPPLPKLPSHPLFPPKNFHHPGFGKWPPLPPLSPIH